MSAAPLVARVDEAGFDPTDEFVFNGLDAESGDHLLSLTVPELADLARKVSFQIGRPLIEDADIHDLASAGWGVVFPQSVDASVRRALEPLLELRRNQAGARYRELMWHPGDSKESFLRRHRAGGAGPVDPHDVPYFLLLVGDPTAMGFDFQYQLDVQYGVGRLDLNRPEHYRAYANAVVAAEKGEMRPPPRRLGFFSVRNPNDRATELSSGALVAPLVERLNAHSYDWELDTVPEEEAVKARLGEMLGGPRTPGLLFTSCHGLGFRLGNTRQRANQGALVCADWAGPGSGSLNRDQYFAASDLPDDADVAGRVAFHFACFGAGTPLYDAFSHRHEGPPAPIADEPFTAGLPKRLLSLGALAVIGHVERAWGCSFLWGGAGGRPQAFEDTLRRLMKGFRVGAATEKLNQRYAELAVDLTLEIERDRHRRLRRAAMDGPPSPLEAPANGGNQLDLVSRWTAHNDARSYVVLGDPAVRLRDPSEL